MADDTRSAEQHDAARAAISALLSVDPRDVGCQQTWDLIHVYAETVTRGEDPEEVMPGITAHLRSCPLCADDYAGLLNALMTAAEVVASSRED